MGKYYTTDEVEARIPYRDISTTTTPSEAQVESWLGEAEGEVEITIEAIGGVVPTDPKRIALIGRHVGDYAEARVRLAYAAAGGDDDNEDGQVQLEQYNEWIKALQSERSYWAAVFAAAQPPIVATSQIRGSATAATAYDPEFVRTGRW